MRNDAKKLKIAIKALEQIASGRLICQEIVYRSLQALEHIQKNGKK